MVKKVLAGLLAVTMVMSLVGCGNKTSSNATGSSDLASGSTSETAAENSITLNFWNVFTGSDGDILREIVDNYNATNTDNITIKMDIMPNDTLQQKLPVQQIQRQTLYCLVLKTLHLM